MLTSHSFIEGIWAFRHFSTWGSWDARASDPRGTLTWCSLQHLRSWDPRASDPRGRLTGVHCYQHLAVHLVSMIVKETSPFVRGSLLLIKCSSVSGHYLTLFHCPALLHAGLWQFVIFSHSGILSLGILLRHFMEVPLMQLVWHFPCGHTRVRFWGRIRCCFLCFSLRAHLRTLVPGWYGEWC